MTIPGPIGGSSRESESLGDASVNNGLKNVIVAAVASEVAHVVDFSNMPPRDPDEVVDIATPFLEEGPLKVEDPEYPYADD